MNAVRSVGALLPPTRRLLLTSAAGGFTAFAGCSALSDPEQTLLSSVHNDTDSRHQGHLLVERDGTAVLRQFLEVAAAPPNAWTTVETVVPLGEMPNGTTRDVTASVGDGMENADSITLGVSSVRRRRHRRTVRTRGRE